MVDTRIIDVRAHIELFDARRSGHATACRSGVRPNHFIHDAAYAIPGIIVFEGRDALAPGESWCARVRFLYPDVLASLQVGTTWRIHEGRRQLGQGRVLQLLAEYRQGRIAPPMLASYPLPH